VARSATVWVFGPLPPPVHGAARVTDLVRRSLEAADAGVRVVAVDSNDAVSTRRRLARMLGGLGRLALVRRRSGAVYVGGAGGEVLWYQAVVVLLARLKGLRTVFHHHSSWYLTRTRWPMRLVAAAGGRRLTHVVLCPGMGATLRERYPRAVDVLVCSNAGLLGEGEPDVARPSAPDGPLVLGHLSNLSIEKGLGRALDTLRRLRGHGVDARLVLAGPTADATAEAVLAEATRELGDALTVMGRLAPEDVDDFYRQVDVFVFPSLYEQEAEPLVVLDAARHGVPTIAHAVGCLPGMVDPAHVVERDGDFADRAVALLTSATPPRRSAAVTEAFAARRAEALRAHAHLVRLLIGG
jgi:glycosyltransferase involved in cell wall biosynthesis